MLLCLKHIKQLLIVVIIKWEIKVLPIDLLELRSYQIQQLLPLDGHLLEVSYCAIQWVIYLKFVCEILKELLLLFKLLHEIRFIFFLLFLEHFDFLIG